MPIRTVPDELEECWPRLEAVGWLPSRVEWVRPAPKGERNRVFVVRHDSENFVVRLAGKKPGHSNKRQKDFALEIHNLAAAADAGVTPRPLVADPFDGLLVLPFIDGQHPVRREVDRDAGVRIARVLRTLHLETGPFLQGTDFLRRIRRRVAEVAADETVARHHSRALPEAGRALGPIVDALETSAPPLAPCHGDLVLENIIDDGRRAFLIDWETSTCGDPHQDVGTVLLRARLSKPVREAFLGAYFEGFPVEEASLGRARARLWQVARALDKALIYWRNGVRRAEVDSRVDGWTRRCSGLLKGRPTRVALEYLGVEAGDIDPGSG